MLNGDEIRSDGIIIPFQVNIDGYRKSIGKWMKNSLDEWFRINQVEIIEKEKAEITIEKWDTQQFTPAHSFAYSSVSIENQKLMKKGKKYDNIIRKI